VNAHQMSRIREPDEKAVLLVADAQYCAKLRVRSHMLLGGKYCLAMGWPCGRDLRPGYQFTLAAFALWWGAQAGRVAARGWCVTSLRCCALVRSIKDVSEKGSRDPRSAATR
jgi:hypothetical protein